MKKKENRKDFFMIFKIFITTPKIERFSSQNSEYSRKELMTLILNQNQKIMDVIKMMKYLKIQMQFII